MVLQRIDETGIATTDALKQGRHFGGLRIGVVGAKNGAYGEQVKPLPLEILDGFGSIDVHFKIERAAAKAQRPRKQSPTLQRPNIAGRHSSSARELFNRHPAVGGIICLRAIDRRMTVRDGTNLGTHGFHPCRLANDQNPGRTLTSVVGGRA